jgi:hypothetical protein
MLLSPVDFFILFFSTVIISTFLYNNFYPKSEKFNFFELDFVKNHKLIPVFYVFYKMLFLFIVGVFLYGISSKGYFSLSRKKIHFLDLNKLQLNDNNIKKIIFLIGFVCLLLVWIDYGSLLFYRVQYIPYKNSPFKIIYQNLLVVLCLLSGVIYKNQKFIATISFLIAMVIGIGIGSRSATIYLLVFGLAYSVFLHPKKTMLFYLFFIPFVFVFFGYNISLRVESNGHGLIPYLNITINKPEIIFKYVIMNVYYTFVFGFYASQETIHLYKNASIANLFTTLNPLPGKMTNWYIIASKLRINKIAPFTAIGELAKYPIFNVFYYLFLGYYFAFIDHFIKLQLLSKKYIWAVLHFLLLVFYIIHSFEYNLRSAHRFVYYSTGIYGLSIIIKKIKTQLPLKTTPDISE